MRVYTKESLQQLKDRIDLVDVLSSHLDLKKSGASYKGLCPFHDEKTPSLIVQKGDKHYHCFGCGAHGDAIEFLMTLQKLTFYDAVEVLAQRFDVRMEVIEGKEEQKGPDKKRMKEALSYAAQFFHFCLLHTKEGQEALQYLYGRGIDLDFIRQFQIGLAPKSFGALYKALRAKNYPDDVLQGAGLIVPSNQGEWRDFFSDRIMFPIHSGTGDVIAFSGRKYKEETFGGKYINTSETLLFKKSRTLFGLNYCRKRIAKERTAIIVEGQFDTLRMIEAGFNITVAGQGTAFGDEHVKELLQLGVSRVYLALDADKAGQEATAKVGNLFQKEGVEVSVIAIPMGKDPDAFLCEKGPEAFIALMQASVDYLSFLVRHLSQGKNLSSPAVKNELILTITKLIRQWNHPVMVHEALRKLASIMQVPEEMVGVGGTAAPHVYIKRPLSIEAGEIDPDRILETDLLRWLLLASDQQDELIALASAHVTSADFRVPICGKIYATFMENQKKESFSDLISLAIDVDDPEAQVLLSNIAHKKINKERAKEHCTEAIQKILNRNWMEKREAIKIRIQSGQCSDQEALELAKQFDALKRNPPTVRANNASGIL